jgi:O-antigen/teichoic acid export membrane protein
MAVSGDLGALPADSSAVAIRGGAIRVVGYGGGVLVSLGSATILVRYLGISSFGRYVTVASLIALVGGVTEAGIIVYGIREWGARSEYDRSQLPANLLTVRLILTGFGIACVIVGYRHVLVLGTLVAGAGLLMQVIADVLSVSLQAQLQLGRLTAVMYGSTTEALTKLYPGLSVGGFAIIDDYFDIAAYRSAVEDFRAQHGITEPIQRIDWTAVHWRREESAALKCRRTRRHTDRERPCA